jgi:hypothetical protein
MEHAELIKRLEAERNDISYRVKNPKPLIQVKVKRVISEQDKKLYFNAGRYAAGDRDKLATEANARFEKIEGASS